jgi:pimeloyl-ACP methyl ester carboxylesterase
VTDLAHEVRGSGPDLVLIHGLGSSRRAWDLIVNDLAADFRVWVIDLPGHGDSDPLADRERVTPGDMAGAVGSFLDRQGVARPHVAGNSLGGWTSLELAANGRVASAVALCPAGLWTPLTRSLPVITFNRWAASVTRPLIPAIMRPTLLRRALMSSGVERPVPYRVAVDAGIALAQARGFAAARDGLLHDAFTRADDIPADVPITVLFGDHDRLLPAPRNQRRDLVPAHARWEVAWKCGHAPMWDVPELTAHVIRATAGRSAG